MNGATARYAAGQLGFGEPTDVITLSTVRGEFKWLTTCRVSARPAPGYKPVTEPEIENPGGIEVPAGEAA